MTLDSLLDRFEAEYLDRHSISDDRRRMVRRELRNLAATLNGHALTEVTPSDLMTFQGAELKRGVARSTLSMRHLAMRSFFGWAELAGLMSDQQVQALYAVGAPSFNKPLPRPYKLSEIERFRELLAAKWPLSDARGLRVYFGGRKSERTYERHISKHARRLQLEAQVSLALAEGLRRIEIHTATVQQLAPDTGALVVRTAKTAKTREVPYHPASARAVSAWLEFRSLLVPGHDRAWLYLGYTRRLEPQTLKQMEDVLAHVGPGDWKWHRFRHTFATERLRAGMPLEKLQIMMGHSRTTSTLAYTEIVNADVRAEAARTDDRFGAALGLGQ